MIFQFVSPLAFYARGFILDCIQRHDHKIQISYPKNRTKMTSFTL
jgi:hypothetical protein